MGDRCRNRANFRRKGFACFGYGGLYDRNRVSDEFLKEADGAIAAAASGVDTALDEGKRFCVLADGFAGEVLVVNGTEELGDLVVPEGGFDGDEAAEFPLTHDEVVEDTALFGGGGAVPAVVVVDQLLHRVHGVSPVFVPT